MVRRRKASGADSGMRIIRIDTDAVSQAIMPERNAQDAALNQLAASIARFGLLQPIVVAGGKCIGEYTLICGARRLAACRLLGWKRIDAVLVNLQDRDRTVYALEDHVLRRDRDVIAEADILRRAGGESLRASSLFCQTQILRRLELCTLPQSVRSLASGYRLSVQQLRPLLGIREEHRQLEAASIIAERALTPRQAERLVFGPERTVHLGGGSRRRAVRAAMEESDRESVHSRQCDGAGLSDPHLRDPDRLLQAGISAAGGDVCQ